MENFLPKTPQYTPDLFLLEQREYHLLFDCGPFMPAVPSVCTAFTVEKMSLWKGGPQDVIPLRVSELPKARVAGTLYLQTPEELIGLDKTLKNGVSFDRKAVRVYVPIDNGEVELFTEAVWMYVGCPSEWEQKIKWDQQQSRCGNIRLGSEYDLADQFLDNNRTLNNHFSYHQTKPAYKTPRYLSVNNPMRGEIFCRRENAREINRIRKDIRKAQVYNYLRRLKIVA